MLFGKLLRRSLLNKRLNSRLNCSKELHGFTGQITGTLEGEGPIVGSYAECNHTFVQEDVNIFAKICGDNNPLHTNPEIAKDSMFKGTIVHGILVSSLFSTLFGASMHGAVYVDQTLKFKRPVHVGTNVIAKMEIINKSHARSGHMLTCSTTVYLDNEHGNAGEYGKTAVEGEARVLLPYESYPKEA